MSRPNLHSTACWRGYERHEHDEDGWCLECDKCLIVDPLADIVAGVPGWPSNAACGWRSRANPARSYTGSPPSDPDE